MPAFRPARGMIGARYARLTGSKAALKQDFQQEMMKIERRLSRILNAIKHNTPEALEYGLRPVFTTSQRYCPVKTGALKASGYIESEETPKGARCVVGYAANGTPQYAIFVHEMIDYYHEDPTTAKFLQYAYQDHYEQILPRIHQELKRKFDQMRALGQR